MKRWNIRQGTSRASVLAIDMDGARARGQEIGFTKPDAIVLVEDRAGLGPLTNTIRAGDRVTILSPQGQHRTGRAVMLGDWGWVLNMGGPHGTPGIADEQNTVKVVKALKR